MSMHRRRFLKGMGVTLALPFLPSLVSRRALASGTDLPRRFLVFYVPNGIQMDWWTPDREGAQFDLKDILLPLAPLHDRISVITGLRNDPARPDGPGDHAAGTGSFLTSAHCFKTEGANIRNGVSIDQIIANTIGTEHRFPSLALSSQGGGNVGGCDSGYSCAYSRNISWIDETTPAARESRARVLFNRLFSGAQAGMTPEMLERKRAYKQSVLDFVLEDAQQLQPRLGHHDRIKLDEYFTGIRELERQLTLGAQNQCTPGDLPEAVEDLPARITQMLDLILLSLRCDLSPVVTYMLGNAGSNRSMPHLGIGDGHHQISHHENDPVKLDQLRRIAAWEMEMVFHLLNGLANTPEGEGSMLDNTLVFFSSECEDGNRHRHSNLPVLLAGGEAMGVRQGIHRRVDDQTPIADLFVGIARTMGVPIDQFGDSQGVLDPRS